jgi:hypothetical protein
MEQEKDIDRIKGEKTVDMLMARIAHELNAIDPRFRFYMEARSGVFVADYHHITGRVRETLPTLRRAVKVESSRLSVMYKARWIDEPYLVGARSFFEEVRRTHPVDLNEMKPMHIAPDIYWRRNSGSREDAEEIDASNSLAIKLGIPLQNTPFGIWEFSPENLKKLGDYIDMSFEK